MIQPEQRRVVARYLLPGFREDLQPKPGTRLVVLSVDRYDDAASIPVYFHGKPHPTRSGPYTTRNFVENCTELVVE